MITDCLRNGGIILYPTDSVYGYACDLSNRKAIQRLARIKKIQPGKAKFSLICSDIQMISEYTRQFSRQVFRILNRCLPGPYTFILEANREVRNLLGQKKSTVGIRIPGTPLPRMIVEELGRPLVNTSLHAEDEIIDYLTDSEEINEQFGHEVDMVIRCGSAGNQPTTIADLTGDEAVIIREGAGPINW